MTSELQKGHHPADVHFFFVCVCGIQSRQSRSHFWRVCVFTSQHVWTCRADRADGLHMLMFSLKQTTGNTRYGSLLQVFLSLSKHLISFVSSSKHLQSCGTRGQGPSLKIWIFVEFVPCPSFFLSSRKLNSWGDVSIFFQQAICPFFHLTHYIT